MLYPNRKIKPTPELLGGMNIIKIARLDRPHVVEADEVLHLDGVFVEELDPMKES